MNPPTIDFTVTSAVDYFPYGAELRSYGKSRYLTTQHERDLETGFDYRGARFYDSEVGRFLSVDPLAAQYPSYSDYAYVAGNPIYFTDPNGKEIVIYYQEGILGEDGKYMRDLDGNILYEDKFVVYEYGQCNSCDNEFVKDVHVALDFLIENGMQRISMGSDEIDIIEYLIESENILTITGSSSVMHKGSNYVDESSVIDWGSHIAGYYDPTNEGGNSLMMYRPYDIFRDQLQPPSLVLLHELGHAFHHFFNANEFKDMSDATDSEYGDEEERWVIENIESPAAIRLGITPRTSHVGYNTPVFGPN